MSVAAVLHELGLEEAADRRREDSTRICGGPWQLARRPVQRTRIAP